MKTVDALLRHCLGPGKLALDIGAHTGAKAERYRALGARVVCVEPLAPCAAALRQRWGGDPGVVVVEAAAGAAPARGVLSVCARAPWLSTLAPAWKTGRFHNEVWASDVEVAVTTLDALLAAHGLPDFCKIDVEGSERAVLAGLSRRIPALSIEFAREGVDETARCLERLGALGYAQFNLALGEAEDFVFARWMPASEVLAFIAGSADPLAWGDVYAVEGDR